MPKLWRQQNLLPWRSEWLRRRHRLLMFGYGVWLLLAILLCASSYFLHWQRQQQWSLLEIDLQQLVVAKRQQLAPLLNRQQQWLYKQTAIKDQQRWLQTSQQPLRHLLSAQVVLRETQGHVRSLGIEGTKMNLQFTSALSWDYLESEHWLPVGGRLRSVEQQAQASGDDVWVLQVELVDPYD